MEHANYLQPNNFVNFLHFQHYSTQTIFQCLPMEVSYQSEDFKGIQIFICQSRENCTSRKIWASDDVFDTANVVFRLPWKAATMVSAGIIC